MGFWSNLFGKPQEKSQSEETESTQPSTTARTAVAEETESTEETVVDEETEEETTAAFDDPDNYETDDFGPFAHLAQNPNQTNFEELWYQLFRLEAAQGQGEQAFAQALAKAGIRNTHHLRQIRETFMRHFGHMPGFDQAMFNARTRESKEAMQAAASNNTKLLEPIEGVDIKTYATIQATLARMGGEGPQAVGKLLAQHNLDDATWKRVDAAWQERMRQQDDMMAMMALMSEYGKHFAAAGQGQYGAAAQAGAGAMDIHGAVGQAPDASAEPCTLDRYAEIMAAQGVWSEQGKDVNAMLKQVFNMNALDWSNMSAYWSAKFQADYKLSLKMMEIQEQYKAKYRGAASGPDDDLSV